MVSPESFNEILKSPEKPRHECGIFGIYYPSADVSRLTFYGLYALQHRGQESVGIAVIENNKIVCHKQMGFVSSLHDEDISKLKGFAAIGHTRYSNTGGTTIANAQPAVCGSKLGEIAVSENGNLVNSENLRKKLSEAGFQPSTLNGSKCSSDGELIVQSIAAAKGEVWVEKIQNASLDFTGAYSLSILAGDTLFGVKDPLGFWPLCLGKINDNGFVLASESCAFDTIGAEFIRELEPGEIVAINGEGIKSFYLPGRVEGRSSFCAFDVNYFLRPESKHLGGEQAYQVRMRLGEQLAIEHPVNADIVISVPDSGEFCAIGYSRQSGIPLVVGFIKNKYIGRTFIMPDQRIRELGVRLKLNPLEEELRGKKIVLGDDSAVRGTNSKMITTMLFELGAKEVHWRFAFPQITHPCHFGIDTYSSKELISAGRTVDEVCKEIGATSVGFNSIEGFERALGKPLSLFCQGCFTGKYPIPVPSQRDKEILEKV